MAFDSQTFLFGDYRIAKVSPVKEAAWHTFGGPADRAGTDRAACGGKLIQLLHRFDLDDPAVPIAVPGLCYLPLYYCFDQRVSQFGYRLVSDELLVPFFDLYDQDAGGGGGEQLFNPAYPLEFPQFNMGVAAFPYDPTDIDDAYGWGGVFGMGRLSGDDIAELKRYLVEDLGIYEDIEEVEADFSDTFGGPFMQGRPSNKCMNPDCPNHHEFGRLRVVAIAPSEAVPGVELFGKWGSGTRMIFMLCPLCNTMTTTNECT